MVIVTLYETGNERTTQSNFRRMSLEQVVLDGQKAFSENGADTNLALKFV